MDDQLDLTFQSKELLSTGLDEWRTSNRKAIERLAREQGLPIGRIARVDFYNGPPCEGVLLLDEDSLFVPDRRMDTLKLAIGRIRFTAADIASCIAVDD